MSDIRSVIEPRRISGLPALPPDAVITCLSPDRNLITRHLSDQSTASLIWDCRTTWGTLDGTIPLSVSGPLYGAPHGALVVEQLIAQGARFIYFLGWCGSIVESLKIGDIVVPRSSLSEEGTSNHYPLAGKRIRASDDLARHIEQGLAKAGTPHTAGKIWTTDAPYRETEAKVREYGNRNILAVEMELSALFRVAMYRGVDLAGILVVSDELSSLRWKSGHRLPAFVEGRKRAADAVIEACRSWHGEWERRSGDNE